MHWFFRLEDGRTGFACRSHASDNLLYADRGSVAVLGVGRVGGLLAGGLTSAGAKVTVADLDESEVIAVMAELLDGLASPTEGRL